MDSILLLKKSSDLVNLDIKLCVICQKSSSSVARLLYQQKIEEKRLLKQLLFEKMKFVET